MKTIAVATEKSICIDLIRLLNLQ